MKIPQGTQIYPISAAQKTLRWSEIFSIQRKKARENNIISGYLRVPSDCDPLALERALNELIKNNDSLRLRLFRTFGGIRQYIKDYTYTELQRIPVDGESGFTAYLAELYQVRLTFFEENLVWARLVTLAPGDCALVLRIHHTAIDGYSIRLIFERLEKYYDSFRRGETPGAEHNYSIVKYFKTQESYAKSKMHKADYRFWLHQYTGQRKFSFPAGYRSELGNCAAETMTVAPETYRKLQALAKAGGCTLQSLMMTLAAVTTYAVTGKENFSVISLTHGRLSSYLRNTIGCMMNTVPIFFDLKPDTSIEKLVPEYYLTFLDTLSHGRLPMSEQMMMSYFEAVKHFFNFNPAWLIFSCLEFGELFERSAYKMSMIRPTYQAHQFYLSMQDVAGERLEFELSYQTHKYNRQTVQKVLGAYAFVIRCAADNPQWSIAQIRQMYNKGETYHDNAAGDTQCNAANSGAGSIGVAQ